jgi:hypothetical protein
MITPTYDFLIVGAGLAGIACAGGLQRAGASVLLLDKGRGVGGRAATRRWDEVRVDHGAQYFTARGERFSGMVAGGIAEGWIKEWCRGYPVWEAGRIVARPEGSPRYACPNGVSELPKRLATGLMVETGATVTSVRRGEANGGSYVAETGDGRAFVGRRLVLNLPPTQLLTVARPLLPVRLASDLEGVTFNPAWTLLLRLESDVPGADWPALEVKGHPALGWVARDHTRRAPGAPPVLVAHGNGEWSQAHLENDPADVIRTLRAATEEVTGSPLTVVDAQVHRWRYAQPTRPLPTPYLWIADTGIGGCGDWCAPGGRVEGALESGWHLAAAAIARR